MRIRLRYVLPIPQMFLAWILMWRSDIWFQHYFSVPQQCGNVGPSPPWSILCAINWPAAIAYIFVWRSRLGHFLSENVQRAIFIALIGILWFWFGRYIEFSWKRGTVVSFSWRPARIVFDLLVTAMAATIAKIQLQSVYESWKGGYFQQTFASSNIVEVWAITILIFFARDAVLCVMEWRKASAG